LIGMPLSGARTCGSDVAPGLLLRCKPIKRATSLGFRCVAPESQTFAVYGPFMVIGNCTFHSMTVGVSVAVGVTTGVSVSIPVDVGVVSVSVAVSVGVYVAEGVGV